METRNQNQSAEDIRKLAKEFRVKSIGVIVDNKKSRIDISDESLRPYGFKFLSRVSTKDGDGTIIGIKDIGTKSNSLVLVLDKTPINENTIICTFLTISQDLKNNIKKLSDVNDRSDLIDLLDKEIKFERTKEDKILNIIEQNRRFEAERLADELGSEIKKAKREAEVKAKREIEERLKREKEERFIRELEKEERIKREMEKRVKREAEEKLKREKEEKAKREAEEKAKREAEEKAKREAEEKQQAQEKAERELKEKQNKAELQAQQENLRALVKNNGIEKLNNYIPEPRVFGLWNTKSYLSLSITDKAFEQFKLNFLDRVSVLMLDGRCLATVVGVEKSSVGPRIWFVLDKDYQAITFTKDGLFPEYELAETGLYKIDYQPIPNQVFEKIQMELSRQIEEKKLADVAEEKRKIEAKKQNEQITLSREEAHRNKMREAEKRAKDQHEAELKRKEDEEKRRIQERKDLEEKAENERIKKINSTSTAKFFPPSSPSVGAQILNKIDKLSGNKISQQKTKNEEKKREKVEDRINELKPL